MEHVFKSKCANNDFKEEVVQEYILVAAIHEAIETLATQSQLAQMGKSIIEEYVDVFTPIPHLDKLPTDVYCHIKLKDVYKTISSHSYSSPRKYCNAWAMHLQVGCIQPSNLLH